MGKQKTYLLLSLLSTLLISYATGSFITRHPAKKCEKEWTLVFRGVAGNSQGIYSKWCARTPSTCYISNGCIPKGTNYNLLQGGKKHLKSQLVNDWNRLNIREVKLGLYKNGKEVAYLIFNGKGSSYTSWFTYSRLIETSWFDLFSDGYFNKFSMNGSHGKTFIINQDHSFTSCTSRRRWWFQIVDSTLSSSYSCGWERVRQYPQFYYSTRNHKARYAYADLSNVTCGLKVKVTKYTTCGYTYGDVMAIYIKY